MSLPVNTFVGVHIAVAPKAKGTKGFGTLAFVTPSAVSAIPEFERFRYYSDFDAVVADFPSGEVYKAASAYYAQNPKPVDFIVAGVYGEDTPATLQGGVPGTLLEMQAVTDGGFDIDIAGTTMSVSGIDLSGIVAIEDVVPIVQSALGGQVLFELVGSNFVITTTATGNDQTIGIPTNGVQSLDVVLGLSTGTVTDGSQVETPAEALAKLWDINHQAYGIALDVMYNDVMEDIDAVADWCEAMKLVFFNTTNDPASLLTGIAGEASTLFQLKERSLAQTISHYTSEVSEYPSCSVAGRAFTVNFEGTNTTITLMYKKLPGITVMNLNPSQYAALVEKNGNAFIDVDGISMYATSVMADGTFFDTIHGTAWLQNSIETGVFNLLYRSPTKVPYTDVGVGMVVQRVEQSLRQGKKNGLIAPGTTPDGDYLAEGFEVTYIPVVDVSQADKSARLYRGISFRAVGAGALHEVEITGSFSE